MKLSRSSQKLRRDKQAQFFTMLGRLIQNGYSINESINFMSTIWLKEKWIKAIKTGLQKGSSFSSVITPYIDDGSVFQISMAQRYGKISDALLVLAKFSENQSKQLKKIKQVIRYPIALVVLLICLMLGIVFYIYPMMSNIVDVKDSILNNEHLKWSVGVGTIGLFVLGIVGPIFLWRIPRIQALRVMMKIPLVGPIVSNVVNYQFSFQLGMLLSSGLEIGDLVNQVLSGEDKGIRYEIAKKIYKEKEQGSPIDVSLSRLHLIDPIIILFFQQGKEKSYVARDLLQFSKITYEDLLKNVNRVINLIQPIIFIFVGACVVLMYIALLSPMYKTIGGNF